MILYLCGLVVNDALYHINPFDTYRVTATRLEKSIVLTHMWFLEMVSFDYILDMYA